MVEFKLKKNRGSFFGSFSFAYLTWQDIVGIVAAIGGGTASLTSARKQFYSSKAWQDCRNGYAKSKRNLCELCLEKGLFTPGEIVHHKIHLNEDNFADPSVALNWDNLQLLCRDCHAKQHSNKRYRVDEMGRVIF